MKFVQRLIFTEPRSNLWRVELKNTLFFQILKTIVLLEVFISAALFLDSEYFEQAYKHGQIIANTLIVVALLYLYSKANKRVREQIIYAVLIATAGEYFFSKFLGMYTYRLENIPHYVPAGHAIVNLAVYNFIRQPKVISNRVKLERILYFVIGIYATYFLVFKNDILGFALTVLAFYFFIKRPKERLFYLSMYLTVAIVELIGTGYGSWWWPSTWFGKIDFLPSANPPSGISIFYFGLDLGCLYFYKLRHKTAWARMKKFRRIRLSKMSDVSAYGAK